MKKLVGLFALSAIALIACSHAEPQGTASIDENALTNGDDDDTVAPAPTCLSTDPIDATQIAYAISHAPQPGACTASEVAAFSQYYRDHAGDDSLIDTWGSSVSDTCRQCIFADTTAGSPLWAPVVIGVDSDGNKAFQVDSGGCIAAASGNEACGETYFQFQTCTLEACLKDCTTQAEFNRCRQDQAVLTTSCKVSYDAMKTACGTQLGAAQTKCKGTSYTFEGPIKVLCQ